MLILVSIPESYLGVYDDIRTVGCDGYTILRHDIRQWFYERGLKAPPIRLWCAPYRNLMGSIVSYVRCHDLMFIDPNVAFEFKIRWC